MARLTRLHDLHDLHALDTAREPLFDAFVRMAADTCGTGVASIVLVDADRQWFAADAGLAGLAGTPREFAFGLHALESDGLLEVPDARDDPRFAGHPSVRSGGGVRYHAGAPLILPCGKRVGALCVFDTRVRALSEAQRATLARLADMVAQALVMRRDLIDRTRAAHRQADEALAVRCAELDDLYVNAPCGYYSLDAGGRFVRINDTALRWFGLTRAELADRPSPSITDFMEPDGRRHFDARFHKLKRDGRAVDFEFTLLSRNGQRRRIAGSANAVRSRDGQFVMTRTVIHDITPIKRAEEARIRAGALEAENRQLQEVARVKGVFLSNMSHELCTPLNAIIGYSHLLGTGAFPSGSPKFARYLADIHASGQQLLARVQQVLALTDAEAGRIALQPRRVELRGLLEGSIDVSQAAARERDVRVRLAMASAPLALVVDPMRLAQAVSEILANAIRFSPPGAEVTMRALAVGTRQVRIEVQDRGIGIAPEDLPRLFKPFQQLSDGLARSHPGAGLGLALVRHLVEALGGRIEVESTPGVGSTFVLAFDQAQGPEPG